MSRMKRLVVALAFIVTFVVAYADLWRSADNYFAAVVDLRNHAARMRKK